MVNTILLMSIGFIIVALLFIFPNFPAWMNDAQKTVIGLAILTLSLVGVYAGIKL